ncbi:MAG: hypothetical protein U9N37_07865, partial [Thermodesulfobacteriota bacterium]|nr:hypothetical protein [Thermodesulfobacteriota bacterium]
MAYLVLLDLGIKLERNGMKKALGIIVFLVIVTCIVLCVANPVPFDEARWRKAVESQSIEKLYAPHFTDG